MNGLDNEIDLDNVIIDTGRKTRSIEEQINAREKQEYNNSIKKVENFWTIATYLLPAILFIIIVIDRILHHAKLSKINNNLEEIKEMLEFKK